MNRCPLRPAQGDPRNLRLDLCGDDLWRDTLSGDGLPLPELGWWFPELSALFLVGGVVIGLIDHMKEEEIVETLWPAVRTCWVWR